ncbi:hypothetical protein DXG01_015858 [Tephrocybe rancida]|nr:hypothetical protein DXG01_015858 [Tephrocybe rancida]
MEEQKRHEQDALERAKRMEEEQLQLIEEDVKVFQEYVLLCVVTEEMGKAADEQERWSPIPWYDYEDYQYYRVSKADKSKIDLADEYKYLVIEAQGGFTEDQGYVDELRGLLPNEEEEIQLWKDEGNDI